MNWYRVEHFPLDKNLSPIIQVLKANRVIHRVTEEAGGQCLWVIEEHHIEPVKQLIDQIASGAVVIDPQEPNESIDVGGEVSQGALTFISAMAQYPVTLIIIILGLIGFCLIEFDHRFEWVSLFTMQPLIIDGGKAYLSTLDQTLEAREYWRLITPIFLHFGVLHIAFNALWVWEFGKKIEQYRSSVTLLSIIFFTGLSSNLAQYWWSGPSMFGGLSGVLYGLLGFIAINQWRNPHTNLKIQPTIIGFLLVWLVIGLTGAINFFIDGSIANAAHTAGLISGLVMGLFWPDNKNTPSHQTH